jgi:hypothetical protein
LQGNFLKNKEILNGWKEIMFFESGSTVNTHTKLKINTAWISTGAQALICVLIELFHYIALICHIITIILL